MEQIARRTRRIVVALALLGVGLLVWLWLVPLWPHSFQPPTLHATLGEDIRSSLSFVAFSPDGRTLASGGSEDGPIRLWDMTTRENTATLEGHEGDATCAAFSPDGETLASEASTNESDTAIRLWNLTSHKPKATIPGNGVRSVAFHPHGLVLAAAGLDGVIRLWDVATAKNTATFETWGVVSVAFMDGKPLPVGNYSKDPDARWGRGLVAEPKAINCTRFGRRMPCRRPGRSPPCTSVRKKSLTA